MPIALFSFKKDSDGQVRIAHVFFAGTRQAAETALRQHAGGCPDFGPAFRAKETIEYVREIPDLPPGDGDELEEWLDEICELAGDEEDDIIDLHGAHDPEDV
jgi:hypothetical protein